MMAQCMVQVRGVCKNDVINELDDYTRAVVSLSTNVCR